MCAMSAQKMTAFRRLFAALAFMIAWSLSFHWNLMGTLSPADLQAAVPRFGVDAQNSRRILDPLEKTGFPFQKIWSCPLGGQAESQPIYAQGSLYVQAGQRLVKVSTDGRIEARSPILSQSELPSGASPTYTWTPYGHRIYQATRDHRLWALDPEDLHPLWKAPLNGELFFELSAAGRPERRYRVTASPLVINHQGKPYIALGTGHGDGTGLPVQFADNGFFVLEDQGLYPKIVYAKSMAGEVTGSPVRFGQSILATQNTGDQPSQLIQFSYETMRLLPDLPSLEAGIPGSPTAEGDRVYLADRESRLYCFQSSDAGTMKLLWTSPGQTDPDHDRISKSYNLKSPVAGDRYVYLPIQQYKDSCGGAVVAVDKNTGRTAAVKTFNTPLRSNLLYWQPADDNTRAYLLVIESDGAASLLDAWTLESVPGFMSEDGTHQMKLALVPMSSEHGAAPEPIIADNLLLLIDGEGTLHAFQGRGPVNFICWSASESESGTDAIQVRLQLSNASRLDYTGIPVTIGELNGPPPSADGSETEDWPEIRLTETTVDLPAGSTESLLVQLPSEAINKTLVAQINPTGHPLEKTEEIKPRSDNRCFFRIGGNFLDLEAIALNGPAMGIPGKRESLKALLCNRSSQDLAKVRIGWYQDGQLLREELQDFKPWETKTLSWLWQSPKEADILQLKVWADPEETLPEQDRLNNQKDLYIRFENKPMIQTCADPMERKDWNVAYSYITGYRQKQRLDCHVDRYGKMICKTVKWTDYSSPIWEQKTVRYTESLSANAQISTLQGNLPDPKHPRDSDEDSRGAWAIIPYAALKGYDPDTVTRAGYGFGLKVTTRYTTDWETKIPKGLKGTAYPIGGTLKGPTQVIAEFYDTRGYKAAETLLQRTGGTDGTGQAIWELPETTHRFSDGRSKSQRKHFTLPDIPDGEYHVLIKVSGAGQHGLYICCTQTVHIFGTMYDDQYNKIRRQAIT